MEGARSAGPGVRGRGQDGAMAGQCLEEDWGRGCRGGITDDFGGKRKLRAGHAGGKRKAHAGEMGGKRRGNWREKRAGRGKIFTIKGGENGDQGKAGTGTGPGCGTGHWEKTLVGTQRGRRRGPW